MNHHINTVIGKREVNPNMDLASIIQTVSMIVLIIDIVFES